MTRIASVKPHPISVPLKDALWTAHEELKASSVIVVEVRTDDGLIGYGQIHGAPMKAICAWVERFGDGGAETRDSFVHLSDQPGFGVEINWDYAKRYAA